MRQIKFRAWDKELKKIYVGLDFNSFSWDYGSVNIDFDDGSFCSSHDLKHCILMQYTGLKDKNGKEIYEGDIILNPEYQKESMEVFWDNRATGFAPFNCSDYAGECKIVGNIYEAQNY